MKFIIILVLLFCFVATSFSQEYEFTYESDIIGIWVGSSNKYTEDYIRCSLQIRFEYLRGSTRTGTYYSILLAKAWGGGLDSWEVNGLFEKTFGEMKIWPATVKIGTIVLPDSLVNNYTFNIIFTSDTTAYIPNMVFGEIKLGKTRK
jgi:hypothetical protein